MKSKFLNRITHEKDITAAIYLAALLLFAVLLLGNAPIYAASKNTLPAPQGASAQATADGVLLQWQPVEGAAGYMVKHSYDGRNYTVVATLGQDELSYMDSASTTDCRYTVVAFSPAYSVGGASDAVAVTQ